MNVPHGPFATIHELASWAWRKGAVIVHGPVPLTLVIFACSWNCPPKHTKSPALNAPVFPRPELTLNVIGVKPVPIGVPVGVITSVARVPHAVEGVTLMSVVKVPGVKLPEGLV